MILMRIHLHITVLGYSQTLAWAKGELLQWQTGIHRVGSASRDRTAAPAFFLVPSQNKQRGKGHLSLAVTNRRPTGTGLVSSCHLNSCMSARLCRFSTKYGGKHKWQVEERQRAGGTKDVACVHTISDWATHWHIVGWITQKWLTTPHYKTERDRNQPKWSTFSPLTRC